jgi:Domain of unknown function (DUF4845)
MRHQTLHTQKGLGLLSLLFWVALLGSLLIVGLKTTPILMEYMAIKKAVFIAKDAGEAGAIRSSFDQQSKVNYVEDFAGRQLQIETNNGLTTVGFAYQRVIPLAGPVSLLFDFSGKELVR